MCGDLEFRSKWGQTYNITLMSSTGNAIPNTAAGMRAEITALGTATATPAVRDLVPLENLDYILNKTIYVSNITFFAYDPMTSSGASPQDPSIVAEIYASRNSTPHKEYPSSRVISGLLPVVHIDNFCRPRLLMNDVNILQGFDSVREGYTNSYGSIGIRPGRCIGINQVISEFKSMKARAAYAAYVDDTTPLYQNYIVLAELEVWADYRGC